MFKNVIFKALVDIVLGTVIRIIKDHFTNNLKLTWK